MARRHVEAQWASAGDTGTAPSVAAQEAGWTATEPPFQLFNWLQNLITEMLEHIEVQGIPQWDAATAYVVGALAMGSNRIVYRAVIANTNEDPITDDGTNWAPFVPLATDAVAGLIEIATQGEVNAGVDGNRAVTPLTLESKIANESNAGVLRVATIAEALALANDARAITPAKLASLIASGSQLGIVRLASNAEVLTGTDSVKAVTALSLTQSASIGASGYYRLPGGFTVQWGTANFPASPTDVTLPLTFPNNIFGAVIGSAPLTGQATVDVGVTPLSTSQIRIATPHLNQNLTWWAWGN